MSSILNFLADSLDPSKSFLSVTPRFIPANWIINLQKGGTIVILYYMMWYYQNFSLGCYIYLSLHASYGK